jgi:hypothetical protein
MLSLTVLVLVALPLTWRRTLLVGSVTVSFVLLFPVAAVRSFYALQLPTKELAATFLIGAAGMTLLVLAWVVSRRLGRGSDPAVLADDD